MVAQTPGLIITACLLLTSCDLPKVLDEVTSNGYGDQNISIPNITVNPKIESFAQDRAKVSEIVIKAPVKGTEIWRGRFTITRFNKVTGYAVSEDTYTPRYILAHDAETSLRNALDYVFEVAPDAEAKVTVELTMAFSNTKLEEKPCSKFRTMTRMQLKLLYSWPDGMKIRKNYDGKGESENCFGFYGVPTGTVAEQTIQQAFDEVFTNLTKARSE